MAIIPTGAIYKSLTFDDISSRDYGVYITGEAVFNAAKREVEMISIPGRNGSFALDKDRFENIEVTYPAGIFASDEADFAKAISDFRNALCSRQGYCRLTDEYNADEYRMAVYKNGLEVTPAMLKAGQFDITFECMPQRFLLSGEEVRDMYDWSDVVTKTADIVQFDNDGSKGVKSLSVEFEPEQDGTPWISDTPEVAPYIFRQSGGGILAEDVKNEFDTIVGGTVAWNQKNNVSSGGGTWAGITYTFSAGGKVTITGTATGTDGLWNYNSLIRSFVGHKVAVVFKETPTGVSFNNVGTKSSIISPSTSVNYGFRVVNGTANVNYESYVAIIDLTALFGSSTIADYLYSLEQTTAGSGIAKLKEWGFDIDSYHAYDAGSLQSVNVSAHNTIGFNQWDEEWESGRINATTGQPEAYNGTIRSKNFIKVIPNTTYCFKPSPTSLLLRNRYYDANYNYIGYEESSIATGDVRLFTPPSNAYYMKFFALGTTYNNDICINISKTTGSPKNGDYVAYEKLSYPLDSDLELRGIPKLDASNNLYYDGDVYPPSGEVGRKYSIVDLGTLDYNYESGNSRFVSTTTIPDLKKQAIRTLTMLCSQKYLCIDDGRGHGAVPNGSIYNGDLDNQVVYIKDGDTTSPSVLKANLSGIYLLYPIEEPTTETADPYTAPQVVSPYGTEEYVDYGVSQGTRDIAVPVGHSTLYGHVVEISGKVEVSAVVSPTLDVQDGTTYSESFGQTYYGGKVEFVEGSLELEWDEIENYNGESINEPWLSSAEVYEEGATPTIGAQVVYPLTTPATVTLTPISISLDEGVNNIWSVDSNVTVEYGTKPGRIVNPTLHDSKPLLMAYGAGKAYVNDEVITLTSEARGEIQILEETEYIQGQTNLYDLIDFDLVEDGDTVYVGDIMFWADIQVPGKTINYNNPPYIEDRGNGSGGAGDGTVEAYFSLKAADSIRFNMVWRGLSFVKGTETTLSHYMRAYVDYTDGTTYSFDFSAPFVYKPQYGTLYINGSQPAYTSNRRGTIKGMTADSSQSALTTPVYIDLDIGEAYGYVDGTLVSLNKYVQIPPELPVLIPGVNKVLRSNSMTKLEIIPRWWKV